MSVAAKRRRRFYERKKYPRVGWMWNPYWRADDMQLANALGRFLTVPVEAVQAYHADCMHLWSRARRSFRKANGEPHWKDDPTYNMRRKR